MISASRHTRLMVLAASSMLWAAPECLSQAPTIEQPALMQSGTTTTPGSTQSLLGTMPGGGANMGMQPGRDDMLFGRAGGTAPPVPTTQTKPPRSQRQAGSIKAQPRPRESPHRSR